MYRGFTNQPLGTGEAPRELGQNPNPDNMPTNPLPPGILRRGRARNVFKLLGSSARSRVMAVAAAPSQTYLTDNSTIAARANNRSVLIEFFVNSSQVI
jgi:hypothetical protein